MGLKDKQHIIVKTQRAGIKWLVVVLLIMGMMVSWWLLFDYGRSRGGFDSQLASEEREELLTYTRVMKKENTHLREKNSMLEQAQEVDRYAYTEIDKNLQVLQDEVLELKEELAFYRGIVGSSNELKGLQIQSLKLEKNGENNSYHFKLILTQFIKGTRQIKGNVRLSVTGMLKGWQKELMHDEVLMQTSRKLKFRFKYFQEIEGDFVLPEGFVPMNIKLRAIPIGEGQTSKEKIYNWLELTA